MISSKEQFGSLTPKIRSAYFDFELISETSYYKIYEAKSAANKATTYTIRALDPSSQFVKRDRDAAMTLFIQEALHLCLQAGSLETVMIEDFEIDGAAAVFVMKQNYYPLQGALNASTVRKHTMNIEKLLKDLVGDINFMYKRMKTTDLKLNLNRVFCIPERNSFFYGDWAAAKPVSRNAHEGIDLNSTVALDPSIQTLRVAAKEVYVLGLIALEAGGVKRKEWEGLFKVKDAELYNAELGSILKKLEWAKTPEPVIKMLKVALKKESSELMRLEELFQNEGTCFIIILVAGNNLSYNKQMV